MGNPCSYPFTPSLQPVPWCPLMCSLNPLVGPRGPGWGSALTPVCGSLSRLEPLRSLAFSLTPRAREVALSCCKHHPWGWENAGQWWCQGLRPFSAVGAHPLLGWGFPSELFCLRVNLCLCV